jgi:hypothetical protein
MGCLNVDKVNLDAGHLANEARQCRQPVRPYTLDSEIEV